MLQAVRKIARKNLWLRSLIGHQMASSGLFDRYLLNAPVTGNWQQRINDTIACPDNAHIPRVAGAGSIQSGKQRMHNGLLINLGSYYGMEVAKVLHFNKGVHEPQEERVFAEVLKHIPKGGTMIEMGAFWAFYSMWFNQAVPNARNIMIEPEAFNIISGKRNFKLNKMQGEFEQAFIGKASGAGSGTPTLCVDDIIARRKLDFVHVLHSDIQGYEFEMLKGAEKSIKAGKIGHIFISTHSEELHRQCLAFLRSYEFFEIAAARPSESFSEDGLIVMRKQQVPGPGKINISLKK